MNHRENGSAILWVLLASLIISIIVKEIRDKVDLRWQALSSLKIKAAKKLIQSYLMNSVDCATTFAQNNISNPLDANQCPALSTGPLDKPLDLYGTVNNSPTILGQKQSGAFNGMMLIGGFLVKASCSSSEKSLIVRVAVPKLNSSGTPIGFAKDRITGALQDFDHPDALAFSGLINDKSIALCFGKGRLTADFATKTNTYTHNPDPSCVFPNNGICELVKTNKPEGNSGDISGIVDLASTDCDGQLCGEGLACRTDLGWYLMSCTEDDNDVFGTFWEELWRINWNGSNYSIIPTSDPTPSRHSRAHDWSIFYHTQPGKLSGCYLKGPNLQRGMRPGGFIPGMREWVDPIPGHTKAPMQYDLTITCARGN